MGRWRRRTRGRTLPLPNRPPHTHASRPYPKWFIFADDDYWMRMTYLCSLIEHLDLRPDKDYALVPADFFNLISSGNRSTMRTSKGALAYNIKCKVPCAHRMPVSGSCCRTVAVAFTVAFIIAQSQSQLQLQSEQ